MAYDESAFIYSIIGRFRNPYEKNKPTTAFKNAYLRLRLRRSYFVIPN